MKNIIKTYLPSHRRYAVLRVVRAISTSTTPIPMPFTRETPPCSVPATLDAYDVRAAERLADGRSDGRLAGRIYSTLSNRWGGQNFDVFNASDAWNATPYNTMFEDIHANFFDIEKSTSKSGHYYAMARLVRAAVMMRVADCYGPIPYSKVADGSFYVEYDSAEDVYKYISSRTSRARRPRSMPMRRSIRRRNRWLTTIRFSQATIRLGRVWPTRSACVRRSARTTARPPRAPAAMPPA